MSDDAAIYTAKRLFTKEETFEDMVDSIWDTQLAGRSNKESDTEKEISLLLKMPPFVLKRVVRIGRWLNDHNLFPKVMIDNDPLFASAFVANLGSVGIEACYHHNYDYGTIPIFLTMGKLKMMPVVNEQGQVVGEGDAGEQTRFILAKIEKALTSAGATLNDVVRTRMFVTNIAEWENIGKVHGLYFKDIKPAATMVEVKSLISPELLVEIEVTALLNE